MEKLKKKHIAQQAVWQNGGFRAFLEGKVLNQSSGFFSNFGAENRHFAKLLGRCASVYKNRTK